MKPEQAKQDKRKQGREREGEINDMTRTEFVFPE